MATRSLAQFLGLRPLDRLQVNDARAIRDMADQRHFGQRADLPFCYFQRVTPDGRLEVCSPNGFIMYVAPEDICDHIPADPIIVRAIPRQKFIQYLGLHHSQKQGAEGAEWYADAYVLAVEKDRWGRIDRVRVHFLDEALNDEGRYYGPLDDESRKILEHLCRRTRLPVVSKSSGSYSAEQGVARANSQAEHLVGRFIRSALKGHSKGVDLISMAGANPISVAKLNQLGVPMSF